MPQKLAWDEGANERRRECVHRILEELRVRAVQERVPIHLQSKRSTLQASRHEVAPKSELHSDGIGSVRKERIANSAHACLHRYIRQWSPRQRYLCQSLPRSNYVQPLGDLYSRQQIEVRNSSAQPWTKDYLGRPTVAILDREVCMLIQGATDVARVRTFIERQSANDGRGGRFDFIRGEPVLLARWPPPGIIASMGKLITWGKRLGLGFPTQWRSRVPWRCIIE